MKVSELKKILAKMDDDLLVVLSADAEGNDYRPLHVVDESLYKVGDHGGEVFDEESTAEDMYMTEEEWTSYKRNAKKAVVLYP